MTRPFVAAALGILLITPAAFAGHDRAHGAAPSEAVLADTQVSTVTITGPREDAELFFKGLGGLKPTTSVNAVREGGNNLWLQRPDDPRLVLFTVRAGAEVIHDSPGSPDLTQVRQVVLMVARTEGGALLAHELTHTIQQSRMAGAGDVVVFVDIPADLDKEAQAKIDAQVRELLSFYEFDGDNAPIIQGSLRGGLNGEAEWEETIREARDAASFFVPEIDDEVVLGWFFGGNPAHLPAQGDHYGADSFAAGHIARGVINSGDEVDIIGLGEEDLRRGNAAGGGSIVTVSDLTAYRKILDRGEAGDNVGLLLRGIEKTDIKRGMLIEGPSGFVGEVSEVRELTGRGVQAIVTLRVYAPVTTGEKHKIRNPGDPSYGRDAVVTGVNGPGRSILDRGEAGDNVGLLLRGTAADELPGEVPIAFATPGFLEPARVVTSDGLIYDPPETERASGLFEGDCGDGTVLLRRGVTASKAFVDWVQKAANSDRSLPELDMRLEFDEMTKVHLGERFLFCVDGREGGRTIGAGQVTEIIE